MLVIKNVAIYAVCPGAEFTSSHVTLTRPNGSLVISHSMQEPDFIYVHVGVKAGGTLEEDEYVEYRYKVRPSSGEKIDTLVNNFEQLAK